MVIFLVYSDRGIVMHIYNLCMFWWSSSFLRCSKLSHQLVNRLFERIKLNHGVRGALKVNRSIWLKKHTDKTLKINGIKHHMQRMNIGLPLQLIARNVENFADFIRVGSEIDVLLQE